MLRRDSGAHGVFRAARKIPDLEKTATSHLRAGILDRFRGMLLCGVSHLVSRKSTPKD